MSKQVLLVTQEVSTFPEHPRFNEIRVVQSFVFLCSILSTNVLFVIVLSLFLYFTASDLPCWYLQTFLTILSYRLCCSL